MFIPCAVPRTASRRDVAFLRLCGSDTVVLLAVRLGHGPSSPSTPPHCYLLEAPLMLCRLYLMLFKDMDSCSRKDRNTAK